MSSIIENNLNFIKNILKNILSNDYFIKFKFNINHPFIEIIVNNNKILVDFNYSIWKYEDKKLRLLFKDTTNNQQKKISTLISILINETESINKIIENSNNNIFFNITLKKKDSTYIKKLQNNMSYKIISTSSSCPYLMDSFNLFPCEFSKGDIILFNGEKVEIIDIEEIK